MRPYERAARLIGDGMTGDGYDVLLQAFRDEPDDPNVLAMMRDGLETRRQFDAALIAAKRVVEMAPNDGIQWDRLGGVLLCLDRFDEARVAIRRAIEFAPENPVHWHQYGLLEYRTGNFRQALRMYEEATALNPYGIPLRLDRAHAALAVGDDLPSALEEYEIRWESLYHLSPWDLRLPEWKGESIEGKRFLLHSEQGYGDAIMTARFARDLVSRGAKLVGLVLPDELVPLIDAQGWDRVRVVNYENLSADDWDIQSPAFSALKWLRYQRSDIDPTPYLEAPPLSTPPLPRTGKLIGVCWASGIRNVDTGARRHAPLGCVATLAEAPNVRLISLQKGEPTAEIRRFGYEGYFSEPLEHCTNFAETAAVIDRLDAVVSVDTAVLHLAAALGKPTFMLCQFTRCWRWWDVSNVLSTGRPWYSNVTVAKQPSPDDWATPIRAAREWITGL